MWHQLLPALEESELEVSRCVYRHNVNILVHPHLIYALGIGHDCSTQTVQPFHFPSFLFRDSWRCLEPLPPEQGSMEYTKQLILSCLLNICQKLSPEGGRIPKGAYFVGSKWGRVICSECECTYHLEIFYFLPCRHSGWGEVQCGTDSPVHPCFWDASDPSPCPFALGYCCWNISCKC